jgi:hypothetical protein
MSTSQQPVVPSTAAAEVSHKADEQRDACEPPADSKTKELGGRGGLEPTRFGDWEKNGRCIDF